MVSHFAYVNNLSRPQNFALLKNPTNLLNQWEELHKRKKRKKTFLYLSKLKKQKKALAAKKVSNVVLTNFSLSKHAFLQKAHNILFPQKRVLNSICFFENVNFPKLITIKHPGYIVDGDNYWKPSEVFRLPNYKL